METTLSPEKPKRKNDMQRSKINHDLAFGMMFAASLVMVFFQLDDLIGAVTLRPYYFVSSIGSTVILIFWMVGARIVNRNGYVPLISVVILFLCSASCLGVGFPSAYGWLFPPLTPLVVTGVTLLQWLILRRYMQRNIDQFALYSFIFFLFVIVYWTGIGVNNIILNHTDDVYYQDHYYYLQDKYYAYADTPVHDLTMYECNSIAIACKNIHSTVQYFTKTITLQTDDTTHSLNLVVDGEIEFMYPVKN
jgi:hypothetical protein